MVGNRRTVKNVKMKMRDEEEEEGGGVEGQERNRIG